MDLHWQLQEAKNRFSELVKKAETKGPQFVSRHGRDVVVVLSMDEYRALTQPKQSLVAFFRSSPLRDFEIDVERDKSESREVEL